MDEYLEFLREKIKAIEGSERLKRELDKALEENRLLSDELAMTKWYLTREQEGNDSLRDEIDETDEDNKETTRELQREIAVLKHEIIHLTPTTHTRRTK